MKKLLTLGVITLSTSVLFSLTADKVNADEVTGQTKDTAVEVNLVDETTVPDPLDPTNPDQKLLVLNSVPAKYTFSSKLVNGSYALTSTLTDQSIKVFNNSSAREWSVKATVKDGKITKSTSSFDVTSFKINNTELVGTAATGIVAKNADTTTANNTGTITTPVTTAGINFTDSSGVLKAGDKITGTISYQLYNTADAS